MIRSVSHSQHEILGWIRDLHCPEGFECDCTFGNGAFWKGGEVPRLCFDITPLKEGVVQADCQSLPVESGSLSNLVFDPPFLTYVKNGRAHQDGGVRLTSRFGGFYSYEDLSFHYSESIREASRVLKKGGKYVFKCQDIIHNHRMHCTHSMVIEMAQKQGFRLLDLFVLSAKHRMPGPQKGKQRHARIFHSYFLVFLRLAS